jgi:hypothetical protein
MGWVDEFFFAKGGHYIAFTLEKLDYNEIADQGCG